jgi:hypothetical protein
MSNLLSASIALVSTLKELQSHNLELGFLNLAEMEAAIELEKDRPPRSLSLADIAGINTLERR